MRTEPAAIIPRAIPEKLAVPDDPGTTTVDPTTGVRCSSIVHKCAVFKRHGGRVDGVNSTAPCSGVVHKRGINNRHGRIGAMDASPGLINGVSREYTVRDRRGSLSAVDAATIQTRVHRDRAILNYRISGFPDPDTSAGWRIVSRDRAVPDRRRGFPAENPSAVFGIPICQREPIESHIRADVTVKTNYRVSGVPVDDRHIGTRFTPKQDDPVVKHQVLDIGARRHQNAVPIKGGIYPGLDRGLIQGDTDNGG